MDGERSRLGIRLAKQRGKEGEGILGGVGREFFSIADNFIQSGKQVGGAEDLVGGGAGLDLGRPTNEERRAVTALENVGLVPTPVAVRLVGLLNKVGNLRGGEQPLSAVKMTIVFSASMLRSRAFSTSPTTQSVSIRKSPYGPMPDSPCHRLAGTIGVCGLVSGR